MNPTLSGGSDFVIRACNQSIALGSRHIGSFPGVLGSSGTQVHFPLPLRSTFMLPSSFISTTLALRDTAFGAAVIAFAIFAASVLRGFFSTAWAAAPDKIETRAVIAENLKTCRRFTVVPPFRWVKGRHRGRNADPEWEV